MYMIMIKESWRTHPLYAVGKIESVPTKPVWNYYSKDESPLTSLKDDSVVDFDAL